MSALVRWMWAKRQCSVPRRPSDSTLTIDLKFCKATTLNNLNQQNCLLTSWTKRQLFATMACPRASTQWAKRKWKRLRLLKLSTRSRKTVAAGTTGDAWCTLMTSMD
jgi:hypothetical protein